jgi:hypothetical protein
MSEAKKEIELKHHCDNHEKCMEMIQAVLDGSASEEDVQHFKSNMDACMPCIDSYNLEKSIKESLKMKVEKKCCPESTIAKIKSSLGFASLAIAMIVLEVKLVELIF